jgi:diguanylate cyclase (GGDEF)-like protein/PAS domain S-box-containing protein
MTMVSRRARLSVAGTALALAALIIAFQWGQARHMRGVALEHAAHETDMLAHLLAEHSQYTVLLVDMALDGAALAPHVANSSAPSNTAFSAAFREIAKGLTFVRSDPVLNPGPPASQAHPGRDTVTPPSSPNEKNATVTITRDLGPVGTASVTLDARAIAFPHRLTSSQTLVGDSVVDGVSLSLTMANGPHQPDDAPPRFTSAVQVGDLPLLAVATLDQSAALASWRQETVTNAIRTTLLVLIIGALTILGLQLMRRQEQDERTREEQAALSRATINGVSHGIGVFDPEGRLVLWNRRFAALRGLPEELVAMGTSLAAIAHHLASCGGPDPKPSDDVGPSPDQTIRECTLTHGIVVELRDTMLPDGYLITTATDVTDRHHAEITLRTAAQRFRLLFEGVSTIAVQGYDDDRRIVFWNAASETLYGYRRDQALGRRLEDLIVPSAQYAKVVRELIDWQDGDIPPASGERLRRRCDGASVPVLSSYARLTTQDGRREFYIIDIDLTEVKRTQDALQASESRFRDYASATSDWFWEMGPDLRFSGFSHRMAETNPLEPVHLIGLTRQEATGNSLETPLWRSHQELLDRHLPFRDFIYPVKVGTAANGYDHDRYVKCSGKPIFDKEGSFLGYRGTACDVTAQVKAEEELRKLSEAVEQSPAAIAIVNACGLVEYVNRRFVETTGYRRDEVENFPLSILEPDDKARLGPWQAPNNNQEWRGELHRRRKDGSLYWELTSITPIIATDGTVDHFLVIGEDLSERKIFEKALSYQTKYDALTGLSNRLSLLARLSEALAADRPDGRLLALLFVNLDHFKVINEVLGHDGGDMLLVEAAQRLIITAPEGGLVARFGGDEFAILLPNIAACVYADAVAVRILSAFSKPFAIDGREFSVTASIGITISPTDGNAPQPLLRNADAAMRQAKAVGRNRYRFFTPEIDRKLGERVALETHLRHAIARDELTLVYQPIADLRTGATIGAEALLRWHNPALGQVPPDHFIPVAEDTGLIVEIGEWVLRQACLEAGGWATIAGHPISVAVNISACQFRRLELIRTITDALAAAGLNADSLELEITERLLVEHASSTMVILDELHEMGIRISIDDFGTGYSSLSYLKHLPVQTLKIDRSFVKDVPTGPRDSALTAAIVALAHNLDLQVIGEGVETQAQLDFLRHHNCDFIQGYLFSRPLPAPAFRAFLAEGRSIAPNTP